MVEAMAVVSAFPPRELPSSRVEPASRRPGEAATARADSPCSPVSHGREHRPGRLGGLVNPGESNLDAANTGTFDPGEPMSGASPSERPR